MVEFDFEYNIISSFYNYYYCHIQKYKSSNNSLQQRQDVDLIKMGQYINLHGTLKCPLVLAYHASGCWLSVLGAGIPYSRDKNERLVCNPSVWKFEIVSVWLCEFITIQYVVIWVWEYESKWFCYIKTLIHVIKNECVTIA